MSIYSNKKNLVSQVWFLSGAGNVEVYNFFGNNAAHESTYINNTINIYFFESLLINSRKLFAIIFLSSSLPINGIDTIHILFDLSKA